MRDEGYNMVFSMNVNNNVCDREVLMSLFEIKSKEASINIHGIKRIHVTCAINTKQKLIDSIWTKSAEIWFLPIHDV